MDFRDFDTRLAAHALLVDSDSVLLALLNVGAEPRWTVTGGGVDLDETPEQAAVREVLEETGYVIELGALLGVDTGLIPSSERLDHGSRPLKNVRVVFEGRVRGGGLRHEQEGTTDQARWFPLNEVPALPRVGLVDAALEFWRRR